jgi:hypothetical protein
MGALDFAVDAFDWTVDAVRMVVGLPPLPPVVVKMAFREPPMVRVPAGLEIETRRAIHSFLQVEQDELILWKGPVPREGRIGVTPLTPGLVHLHLALESRHPAARHGCVVAETVVEPLPNGPAVERFDVPAKVRLGESVACAWHVPAAKRVRVAVIEDGNAVDHLGPPSGQIVLAPDRPGKLMLRLTAENDWGQSTQMRVVEVEAPKVRIELPLPAVQAGHPGEEVRFAWKVEAESVWLISPGCDAPERLDDKDAGFREGGFLFVRLGWRPVEFQLIARGYGGAEDSVTFRAVPQPFACLEEGEG